MLRITNTENHMGITLHGDYEDLSQLRKTLADMNDLYYDSLSDFVKDFFKKQEESEVLKQRLQEIYEEKNYFLSLNYDIRHCFMGDRNYELINNNHRALSDRKSWAEEDSSIHRKFEKLIEMTAHGNLQFSVEIMYPPVLYYFFVIREMIILFLDDGVLDDLSETHSRRFAHFPGSRTELWKELGILLEFYGLLSSALEEELGKDAYGNLMAYMEEDTHRNNDVIYPDLLCHYYASAGRKASTETKKAMILAMAYELYNYTDTIHSTVHKEAEKEYQTARDIIKKNTRITFPRYNLYDKQIRTFVAQLDHTFYRKDFEDFLNKKYGKVSEEVWNNIFETDPWPKALREI